MKRRTSLRRVVIALIAGVVTGAAALAGAAPASPTSPDQGQTVEAGWALVGAAKMSIEPRPDDYGGTWETDHSRCARMDENLLTGLFDNTAEHLSHLVHAGSPWPENPNCIYTGGYGIGPANPVTSWDDEYGLWVRSVAIGDGDDTLVLTVVDGVGYWWDYASKCADCGTKQIAETVGAELGINPAGIVVASTHSHTAPDFVGGWGFVPDWYMDQVADTIRAAITDAVATMEPAILEVGEELARDHNRERRGTYRSAEEQQLTWLRAYAPAAGQSGVAPQSAPDPGAAVVGGSGLLPRTGPSGWSGSGLLIVVVGAAIVLALRARRSEVPRTRRRLRRWSGMTAVLAVGIAVSLPRTETEVTLSVLAPDDGVRTIATVGAYAAHPTTMGTNGGQAHADWPGLFTHRIEERFGGTGLLVMTGLGNMSTAGGTEMGTRLADLVPAVGAGLRLESTDVRSARQVWNQPATNVPLTVLGAAGFFDRQFNLQPAELITGKNPDTAPCVSAAPYHVEVAVGAARIGDQFALTTAPGEIFANFSNTLKEQSGAIVTMPIGQAMDALGYMPQDFEMSPIGQQGLGFVLDGVLFVNYEDSYAIDRCFGDMALETSIELLDQLRD